jgi:Novel STAND NTPase 1
MNVPTTRYPGAQPFSDDAISRKIFFGREREVVELTDQILANRMVVVYGRSGLGKSSLLNAGVAQRLRDEGHLPLVVRVNDIQNGPRASILQGIGATAERQEIEYSAGDPVSLWSFFKTAEFWRGDILATPVLILDQFEELFTLQSPEARMNFLSELGYLVRGVAPPDFVDAHPDLSIAAPVVHVVLSLREDFLGLLEEAADRIPQILHHRFRLTPLSLHAAAAALTGPAAIDDSALETRPFRYDPKAVEHILDYLSRRRAPALVETARNIEPFQLQLICQRSERIARERQRQSADNVVLTIDDIGGEAALRDTLKDFYRHALAAVPGRRERQAARRLCVNYLISPEGRRLSLEESEIKRQLRLSSETLGQLVSNRLLRCDSRADSMYYELSHDALIEPVLATRQARGFLLGSLGLVAGGISWLATLAVLVITGFLFIAAVFNTLFTIFGMEPPAEWDWTTNDVIWLAFIASLLMLFVMVTFSKAIFSRGQRTIRRYLLRRRQAVLLEPAIAAEIDLLLGWPAVVGGSLWLFLSAVIMIVVSMQLGYHYLGIGSRDESFSLFYERGPQLDMAAIVVGVLALLSLGIGTVKWGYRRVRPFRQAAGFAQSDTIQERRRALLFGCLRIIGGGIAMLAGMFLAAEVLVNVECMSHSGGTMPEWFPVHWWSFTDLHRDCQSNYQKGFNAGVATNYAFNVIMALGVLAFAVNWLVRGARTVLGSVHTTGIEANI